MFLPNHSRPVRNIYSNNNVTKSASNVLYLGQNSAQYNQSVSAYNQEQVDGNKSQLGGPVKMASILPYKPETVDSFKDDLRRKYGSVQNKTVQVKILKFQKERKNKHMRFGERNSVINRQQNGVKTSLSQMNTKQTQKSTGKSKKKKSLENHGKLPEVVKDYNQNYYKRSLVPPAHFFNETQMSNESKNMGDGTRIQSEPTKTDFFISIQQNNKTPQNFYQSNDQMVQDCMFISGQETVMTHGMDSNDDKMPPNNLSHSLYSNIQRQSYLANLREHKKLIYQQKKQSELNQKKLKMMQRHATQRQSRNGQEPFNNAPNLNKTQEQSFKQTQGSILPYHNSENFHSISSNEGAPDLSFFNQRNQNYFNDFQNHHLLDQNRHKAKTTMQKSKTKTNATHSPFEVSSRSKPVNRVSSKIKAVRESKMMDQHKLSLKQLIVKNINVSKMAEKFKEYTDYALGSNSARIIEESFAQQNQSNHYTKPSLQSWSKNQSGNFDQTDISLSHEVSRMAPIAGRESSESKIIDKNQLINIVGQDQQKALLSQQNSIATQVSIKYEEEKNGSTVKTVVHKNKNPSDVSNALVKNMRFSSKRKQNLQPIVPIDTLKLAPSQASMKQSSKDHLSRWVSENNMASTSRQDSLSKNLINQGQNEIQIGERKISTTVADYNQTPQIGQRQSQSHDQVIEVSYLDSSFRRCQERRLDVKQLLDTPYTFAPHLRQAMLENLNKLSESIKDSNKNSSFKLDNQLCKNDKLLRNNVVDLNIDLANGLDQTLHKNQYENHVQSKIAGKSNKNSYQTPSDGYNSSRMKDHSRQSSRILSREKRSSLEQQANQIKQFENTRNYSHSVEPNQTKPSYVPGKTTEETSIRNPIVQSHEANSSEYSCFQLQNVMPPIQKGKSGSIPLQFSFGGQSKIGMQDDVNIYSNGINVMSKEKKKSLFNSSKTQHLDSELGSSNQWVQQPIKTINPVIANVCLITEPLNTSIKQSMQTSHAQLKGISSLTKNKTTVMENSNSIYYGNQVNAPNPMMNRSSYFHSSNSFYESKSKKLDVYSSYNNIVNYKEIVRNVIKKSESRLKQARLDSEDFVQYEQEQEQQQDPEKHNIYEGNTFRDSNRQEPDQNLNKNCLNLQLTEKADLFDNKTDEETFVPLEGTKSEKNIILLSNQKNGNVMLKNFQLDDSRDMSQNAKDIINSHVTSVQNFSRKNIDQFQTLRKIHHVKFRHDLKSTKSGGKEMSNKKESNSMHSPQESLVLTCNGLQSKFTNLNNERSKSQGSNPYNEGRLQSLRSIQKMTSRSGTKKIKLVQSDESNAGMLQTTSEFDPDQILQLTDLIKVQQLQKNIIKIQEDLVKNLQTSKSKSDFRNTQKLQLNEENDLTPKTPLKSADRHVSNKVSEMENKASLEMYHDKSSIEKKSDNKYLMNQDLRSIKDLSGGNNSFSNSVSNKITRDKGLLSLFRLEQTMPRSIPEPMDQTTVILHINKRPTEQQKSEENTSFFVKKQTILASEISHPKEISDPSLYNEMEYMAFLSRNLELLYIREQELIQMEKEHRDNNFIEQNLYQLNQQLILMGNRRKEELKTQEYKFRVPEQMFNRSIEDSNVFDKFNSSFGLKKALKSKKVSLKRGMTTYASRSTVAKNNNTQNDKSHQVEMLLNQDY